MGRSRESPSNMSMNPSNRGPKIRRVLLGQQDGLNRSKQQLANSPAAAGLEWDQAALEQSWQRETYERHGFSQRGEDSALSSAILMTAVAGEVSSASE